MARQSKNDLPELARNIKRFRDLCGISQDTLAERAGIASVKMIESGKHGAHISTLRAIAKVLGCTMADLFDDPDAPMNDVLRSFLDSPAAADVTENEVAELKRLRACGMRPTETTYYIGLQMLRSMKPKENT